MTTQAMMVHDGQQQTAWTRERRDLIKQTVCPRGTSDAEFELFEAQCMRTGLDPLIQQAFCVPRGGKNTFQPAESGMLARAETFPDYLGTTSGAVYAKDAVEIDPGAGTVKHVFSPVGERGALVGAWARVCRVGRIPVVKWLLLKDYSQTSGQWPTKGATMIQKCAKVSALRDSFPTIFGGIYINGEMPDESSVPPPPTRAAPAPRQIAAAPVADSSTTDAEFSHKHAEQQHTPKVDLAAKLKDAIMAMDEATANGDVTALALVKARLRIDPFPDGSEELVLARAHFTKCDGLLKAPGVAA